MSDALEQDGGIQEFLKAQTQTEEPSPQNQPATPATPSVSEWEYEGKKYNPKELVGGYLRQQDYTKKTQEIADERRALEAERQKFSEAWGRSMREIVAPETAQPKNPYADINSHQYDPAMAKAWELEQKISGLEKDRENFRQWQNTVQNQAQEFTLAQKSQTVLQEQLQRPEYADLSREEQNKIARDYQTILRLSRLDGKPIDPEQAFKYAHDYNEQFAQAYVKRKAQKYQSTKLPKFSTGGGNTQGVSKAPEIKARPGQDPFDAAAEAAHQLYG